MLVREILIKKKCKYIIPQSAQAEVTRCHQFISGCLPLLKTGTLFITDNSNILWSNSKRAPCVVNNRNQKYNQSYRERRHRTKLEAVSVHFVNNLRLLGLWW